MASIKMCDIDGQMFVERAPNSVRINDAVIYDDNGKPRPFSGDLCPTCGSAITGIHKSIQALPAKVEYTDHEGQETLRDDDNLPPF